MERMTGSRAIFHALVLGAIGGCAANPPATRVAATAATGAEHAVDLTHTLDERFPFIPVPGITFPFGLAPIATLDAHGVAANRWQIHEHLGTQIDAPSHFAKGGRSLEQLRTEELRAPLAVIDIRARAQRDADAQVTVADLLDWERAHGPLPPGAAVVMNSGWQAHVGDAARYIGLDAAGVKHFPGFSLESLEFLLRERNIWGVGVDTISFDPGNDGKYLGHRALLGADKLALEAVANLDRVPAAGAMLDIGAVKVRGATGGPVRLVARWTGPAVAIPIDGAWRSAAPEPMPAAANGDVNWLWREFEFADGRWTIRFVVFDDAERRVALLSGENAGRFDIVARDGVAPAEFGFDSRRLTPRSETMARALSAAGCGNGVSTAGGSTWVSALRTAICARRRNARRARGRRCAARIVVRASCPWARPR
jgi:kynurenine formamidase